MFNDFTGISLFTSLRKYDARQNNAIEGSYLKNGGNQPFS